jgi:hypothetical protein
MKLPRQLQRPPVTKRHVSRRSLLGLKVEYIPDENESS